MFGEKLQNRTGADSAYYCCLAVERGVSQDEINRTLTEFFSGHPSISPEYNHTVSAGSAKPASVQTRRDVMRSLLPVANEAAEPDLEEVDPDNADDSERFEEDHTAYNSGFSEQTA